MPSTSYSGRQLLVNNELVLFALYREDGQMVYRAVVPPGPLVQEAITEARQLLGLGEQPIRWQHFSR